MRSTQPDGLDELIMKIRSGRMRRRTFLERAMGLGLSASMAGSVLAACGGSADSAGGNGPALNVIWRSEDDPAGVYPKLVEQFNQTNTDGIHITQLHSPIDSAHLHTIFLNMLSTRSAEVDIISMDIVWPAEFALNQWIVPINDKWLQSERGDYLPGPIQGCTLGDQIWAAPLRTDAGLLYYRQDLTTTSPQTWNELTQMAQQSQASNATKYGYVWQGAQNEGLVCCFAEVLYSFGGTVLDPRNPKTVTVNSSAGIQALTTMVNWADSISSNVTTLKTQNDVVAVWQQGNAAFMRNWPAAYSLSNVPSSKVAHKFTVSSLPYGGTNTTGHSVIGGWQLGINAFSNADKIDAAWKFIHFMLSHDAQKAIALGALLPTLKSIYDDADVQAKNPFFKQLGPILKAALPRPVSPRYPDISNAMQARVEQALTKQLSPEGALIALQNDLQLLVTL